MPVEVEISKEDEVKEQQLQQKKTLKQRINEYWQIGLKLLELVFCLICLFFAAEAVKITGLGSSHMNHIAIMFTAYTGFFLINLLLVLNKFVGEKMPYKTVAMYAFLGSTFFLITTILLIVCRTFLKKHYGYTSDMNLMSNLMISLSFSFLNCIVFAVDAIYTFKKMEDF